MNILILGSCQAEILANLIENMCTDVMVTPIRLMPAIRERLKSGELDISTLMAESSLILVQSQRILRLIERLFPHEINKIILFPNILFTAFHPDMININNQLRSPTGFLHSSLACYGWVHGLSINETVALFCEEVFHRLGFFDYWEISMKSLTEEGNDARLPLVNLIDGWAKRGIWMHSIYHPKLFVLADLAREILRREGINFVPDVERNMPDTLKRPSWKVYPEIAHRLGVEGGYQFKGVGHSKHFFDLENFVRASFEQYASYRKEDFDCPRLASSPYQKLGSFLQGRRQAKPGKSSSITATINSEASFNAGLNPYRDLPDHQFWRRAIGRLPMQEVDPVVRSRFSLQKSDRVATAGSCFAQHISRSLRKHGFTYYIAERNDDLQPEEAQQQNYGVFSARYGNIYTARQLVQLFDRAYGTFTPAGNAWMRSDGRWVDPFRPQINPEAFATVEELEESRAEHFMAVRELFENLDFFVFTLGLTEAWRSRVDGAVYPTAPGVVAGEMHPGSHEFVNFGISDVLIDMHLFIKKLLGVNSRAKMILTVSPVPLIATYENRHVLVANTYSKSVLRVAAEEISQRNPMCDYFPSYETITGNHAKGAYFESDLRSVTSEGVNHVMRLFFAHYAAGGQDNRFEQELMRENDLMSEVICDEEVIDAESV